MTFEASSSGAGKYCGNMDFGGKTDWYLPSQTEFRWIDFWNSVLTPTQSLTIGSNYWVSKETHATSAAAILAQGGGGGLNLTVANKNDLYRVRCMRRRPMSE
jgi:hypothetical protein